MAGAGQVRVALGLTPRGWSVLCAGVGLCAVGLVLSLPALMQFALLLTVLPLACALLTRPPTRSLEVTRRLSDREPASGETIHVTVGIRGRLPAGGVLIEDPLPESLGGTRRLAVPGARGTTQSRPHYDIVAGRRGVHELGHIRLHVVDPFGMVRRTRVYPTAEELLVTPAVVRLPLATLGGSSGSGTHHLGSVGASSDDVIPRAYASGDEIRRIDWKASARAGSLMVRSEENPWRGCVRIVVDLRAQAHHGREPGSSLDLALCAAASIGDLALREGWDLEISAVDGRAILAADRLTQTGTRRRAMLEALATVSESQAAEGASVRAQHGDAGTSAPVVLVTGALDAARADRLAGLGGGTRTRLCLAIDARRWELDSRSRRHPLLEDVAQREGIAQLQGNGWRVAALRPDTSLTHAWAELAGAR